jgi:AcrR family transcriptional regulator
VRDIASRAGVKEPSIYHFFGDRNGLIEEAQAARFRMEQVSALTVFASAVPGCRTKTEFNNLVRTALTSSFAPGSEPRRRTRVNVLGSAVNRPSLEQRLVVEQRRVNKMLGDALRYAQAMRFIRPNVDCEVLAVWIVGMMTGRIFSEMDPANDGSKAWDDLAIDAVFAVLGTPPPSLTRWSKRTGR